MSAQEDVEMQWGVRIPMRDGVHLNATLYLPRNQPTPSPVIFELTPYTGQFFHEQGLYFAARGYPFLTVDVRGRGNSEGVFCPLINEAQDGFDVVEWLAQLPCCNGKVAMMGGSYGGYVQWAAASQFPPHLTTIVPTASPFIGVDFPIRNNIASPYWMQWLTLVWGRTLQDRVFWNNERFWGGRFRRWFESGVPFRDLDSQLGSPSPVFQQWVSHPHQDTYWDNHNPTAEQYERISIPVLTITGSFDGDQLGALTHYREHLKHNPDGQHYLVIGPWDHAGTRSPKAEFCGVKVGPESLVDLHKLHLQWYAWTMKGGPKPEFLQKSVAYYVMGSERWRYSESLEAITARSLLFHFHSVGNPTDVFKSGSLVAEKVNSSPDHYIYDPRDLSLAELESTVDPESRADHRIVYASVGRQLSYHSALFGGDIEVSGFFRVVVWLGIDQPDTDFRISIYDVDVDGHATRLTEDSMRARHRESLRAEVLVTEETPLRYAFERFPFVSRRIRRGNRLRVVIGPINSIYSQRNFNSGGAVSGESERDARVVTVRLFHDETHPSALYVPVGKPEA